MNKYEALLTSVKLTYGEMVALTVGLEYLQRHVAAGIVHGSPHAVPVLQKLERARSRALRKMARMADRDRKLFHEKK